ncbi:MFS transporter [Vibrio tapetis subsp. quintayensis]|uniref:MFS transporter n=1 Tax=Vibrio tapetis TaxID=52443 RepID=UPI0025B5DFDE|nr:MFS transporter [Vibrio tapetis]MDN3680673.1 MFS transporter [Vibrio tapetis subsp. quintayensis]
MENTLTNQTQNTITVPVLALALFAVATGYLMSLIPLMLQQYGMGTHLASWLASSFYAGLLVGAVCIESLVSKLGHTQSFIFCLVVLAVTVIVKPLFPVEAIWLFARFVAGIAVAGVFVIVESWLLTGDETSRGKRLGIYMAALYGGSSIGQLGINVIGVHGYAPFITIVSLIDVAILVLFTAKTANPVSSGHESLTLRQILKMNKAALIGCIVSGLVLGAIYGLMPIELKQRNIETTHIGSLMALVILGGMIVQPIVTWLLKHIARTLLMALFCLVGVFAVGLTSVSNSEVILAFALALLGMATFALYPIAINLGCDKLHESNIVSATQVMLFSYSVGSVSGPIVANQFMNSAEGLMGYLFIALLATSIYMLLASLNHQPTVMAGE